MAWIELHQSIRDHRKIVDLAARLNIPEQYAAGLCIYMWTWALDNAPEGVLEMSARLVTKASGWTGDEDDFLSAMLLSKWLEKTPENTLYIHDWEQYAGRLIEKRREDAARKRASRAEKSKVTKRPKDIRKTSAGHPDDIPRMSSVTVPNRTVPKELDAVDADARAEIVPVDTATPSGGNPVPIQPRDDYLDIEAVVVPLLNRSMLSTDEVHMIDDLVKSGVSRETIIRGITESFANHKPKNSRDKINKLTYCRNHILDLHDIATYEPQEIATGRSGANGAHLSNDSRTSPANPKRTAGQSFRARREAANADADLRVPDLPG